MAVFGRAVSQVGFTFGSVPVDEDEAEELMSSDGNARSISDDATIFNGVIGSLSERRTEVDFDWTVPNYFSLTTSSTTYFDSPAFLFSGCSWYIRVFPTGKSSSDSISLFLYKEDSDLTKSMTFTLGIRKLDSTVYRKDFCNQTFKRGQLGWGWTNYMVRETLLKEKSKFTRSDALTFTCSMKDSAPPGVEVAPLPIRLIALEPLSSNFRDLLTSKNNWDVTIKVKNQEFQVHRIVLMARSTVFAAMFQHEMAEKNSGEINIEDCDVESFVDFLKYLYTGKAENLSFRNAYHLYSTANKYDVRELKAFCLLHMIRNLTVENICEVVNLADHYSDEKLLASAQAFFNRNVGTILSTPEWEALLKDNYLLANKMFKDMASKIKI